MSIEVNDGMFILAPKPADEKIIVGPGAFVKFSQLDDIPESYRYSGMLVYDNNVGVKASFRLDDDLVTWNQVLGLHDIFAGVGILINKADANNPVISAIPSSTAGLFGFVFFTADPSDQVGYYSVKQNDKGNALSLSMVVSSDGATVWYADAGGQDFLGDVRPEDVDIKAGVYTGTISIQSTLTSSQLEWFIEVYEADVDGTPIDSGVIGAPVGSLGVPVVTILSTGLVDLASNDETQLSVTGTVASAHLGLAGKRLRYRVGGLKVDALGIAEDLTFYFGQTHQGYVSVPVPVTTDTVENVSTYIGATQSDVNDAIKIEQGTQDTNISNNYALILANQSDISQNALDILRRTKPMGTHVLNQQYEPYDQVLDQGYLAYALVQTTERPAPQLIGEPFYAYTGTLTDQPVSGKQLIFGNRYMFDIAGFVTAYSVYTVEGYYYTIYLIKDPTATPIISQLLSFTATSTGWREFPVAQELVSAGSIFDIVAVTVKQGDVDVVFDGTWNYTTPSNTTTPLAGQITHSSKSIDTMLVSKLDDAADDRAAELSTLGVGDRIAALGATWVIQSTEDSGSYMTFGVSPESQASPTGLALFTFSTVNVTTLESGIDVDYWATTGQFPGGSAQGLLGVDIPYDEIIPNNNAYGINLEVQRATISTDWFIQSTPEGGSSGGGGGIPDAPFTGEIFGRRDGVWTTVTVETQADIVATVAAGDISVGDTVLEGSSLDDFINQLIAPVLGASITAQENLTISGISSGTSNREIGSPYVNTGVSHSFSRGTIKNANGSGNVPLVGAEIDYVFSGLGIDPVTGDIDYKVTSSSVRWTVSNNFDEGTDPYYNSDGSVGNNIPASERAAGSDTANSGYVRGYYKYWYATGAEGGTPTDSAGVRVLANYSWAIPTTFGITIAQGLREISIYIPDTMSVSSITYDESSGAPVLSTFAITTLTVNDGGGDPVNYKKYTQVVKATAGYPAIANYTVTIKTP